MTSSHFIMSCSIHCVLLPGFFRILISYALRSATVYFLSAQIKQT